MGKNPAFQWYPADWLRDPELRMASLVSRGIWMDLLCHMWAARTRGELAGTVTQLAQLVGTGIEEIEHFISEAESLKFADVTIRNGEVTVRNRRMMREERDRQNNAKRQANFRARAERTTEDNAEHNAFSNGGVTPPSSSSSSSSSSKKRDNTSESKMDASRPRAYSADFEEFWSNYPTRSGSNPKSPAFALFEKRCTDGIEPKALIDGARRYATWCSATGKIDTETVMQAKRFLGVNERGWENEWRLPVPAVVDRNGPGRSRNETPIEMAKRRLAEVSNGSSGSKTDHIDAGSRVSSLASQ
jgi:hypothetical protein